MWEEVSASRWGAAPLLMLPRSLKEMVGLLPKDSGQSLDHSSIGSASWWPPPSL